MVDHRLPKRIIPSMWWIIVFQNGSCHPCGGSSSSKTDHAIHVVDHRLPKRIMPSMWWIIVFQNGSCHPCGGSSSSKTDHAIHVVDHRLPKRIRPSVWWIIVFQNGSCHLCGGSSSSKTDQAIRVADHRLPKRIRPSVWWIIVFQNGSGHPCGGSSSSKTDHAIRVVDHRLPKRIMHWELCKEMTYQGRPESGTKTTPRSLYPVGKHQTERPCESSPVQMKMASSDPEAASGFKDDEMQRVQTARDGRLKTPSSPWAASASRAVDWSPAKAGRKLQALVYDILPSRRSDARSVGRTQSLQLRGRPNEVVTCKGSRSF